MAIGSQWESIYVPVEQVTRLRGQRTATNGTKARPLRSGFVSLRTRDNHIIGHSVFIRARTAKDGILTKARWGNSLTSCEPFRPR